MKFQFILLAVVVLSCKAKPYLRLEGKTMGTYYDIHYSSEKNYKQQIDSLLNSFIAAASTYDSTSELSTFNRTGVLHYRSPYLFRMLTVASRLHRETHGAFEPTLMPLIRAHGFSTFKREALDQEDIDSLLSFVSFNYITFDDREMRTLKQGVELDLSAMGEGFAIDLIADFLQRKNVQNYKIEIGGEMKCKGRNAKDETWVIGIENPSQTGQLLTTTRLENQAISTSGASRKFYTDANGKKRSHIINPQTGYSIEYDLLSVTVKDSLAVRADVMATALMVMGLDSAKRFIAIRNLEAFIVYEKNGKVLSWHTADFLNNEDRNIALE